MIDHMEQLWRAVPSGDDFVLLVYHSEGCPMCKEEDLLALGKCDPQLSFQFVDVSGLLRLRCGGQ